MRWIGLVGVLVALALAGPALAGHHAWSAYSLGYAPPCVMPMAPGCCERQPSCCDNVWAGFCQEKSRHQDKHGRGTPVCGAACGGCGSGCGGAAAGGAPAAPVDPGGAAPSAPPAATPPPGPVPTRPAPATKTTLRNPYYWPG